MKEILEAKLAQFNEWLKDLDMPGYGWTLGQRDLCVELLSICSHKEEAYDSHFDDYYYDDDYYDYYYDDPLEEYNSDLEYYKQQEIDDMYNKHNHFSWWIGKNVLHTDSMWFTSDEIEAFRIIWQRRLSA